MKKDRLTRDVKIFLKEFCDFFLPRLCPACTRKLSVEESCVCSNCFSKIDNADQSRIDHEFRRKFEEKKIISGFASLYVFEKDKELQHIIHSLKYQQRLQNGIFLGKVLGLNLSEKIKQWNVDLLIPIPLHSVKKAERGYNQSYYISKGLSRIVTIPTEASAVKRIKNTQSQTTMNIVERAENMSNAFKVKKRNRIKGKTILLIDDVITTGATTAECGKVLLEAGAARVYAASVAIAD